MSFAGLGHPGRYTLCFGENRAANPWDALHVDHGFAEEDTVLTVMRAESVINVTGGLAELADVMGSGASAFSLARGGKVAVVVAPFTARQLADQGWSKRDVQVYLHEHGRLPPERWERLWITKNVVAATGAPHWLRPGGPSGHLPIVELPSDITVVVAGGDVPIAQQAYFPTWGHPDCRIMIPIEFGAPVGPLAQPET